MPTCLQVTYRILEWIKSDEGFASLYELDYLQKIWLAGKSVKEMLRFRQEWEHMVVRVTGIDQTMKTQMLYERLAEGKHPRVGAQLFPPVQ